MVLMFKPWLYINCYYLDHVLLLYVLRFNVSVADPWLLKFTDSDAEHFCAVLVK